MPKMINKPIMDWLKAEIAYQARKNDKSAKTLLLKKMEVYLNKQIEKHGEAQILMAIAYVCSTKAQKKTFQKLLTSRRFSYRIKKALGLRIQEEAEKFDMPHGRLNGYKDAIKAAIETRQHKVIIKKPSSIALNPALIKKIIDAQTRKNIDRLQSYIDNLTDASRPIRAEAELTKDPEMLKKTEDILKILRTKDALKQEFVAAGETLKRELNILAVGNNPQKQTTEMIQLFTKLASKKPQTSALVVLSQDILENLHKEPKQMTKTKAKIVSDKPTTPLAVALSIISQEILLSQKTILSKVDPLLTKIEADLADRQAKLQTINRSRDLPIEKEISTIRNYFNKHPDYASHPVGERILDAMTKLEVEFASLPPPPPPPLITHMHKRKKQSEIPPPPPPPPPPASRKQKRGMK